MRLSLGTEIAASPKKVWSIIADIENAADTIEGIVKLEVLEKPKGRSIVGLKWEETRVFAGREATEIMWVTDAQAPSFYETRAESHGSIYESRMDIEATDSGCILTMSFEGTPQTIGAKVLWALTGWMAKGPMKKTITKDLEDIKRAAEA